MRKHKPDEIKDLLKDYMGASLTIDIKGKKFELDMRINDLTELISATKESQITDESLKKTVKVLLHLFFRSYLPYWDDTKDCELEGLNSAQNIEQSEIKQGLSNVLMLNYSEVFNQIGKKLHWVTEGESKKIQKKVEELKKAGSRPQQ